MEGTTKKALLNAKTKAKKVSNLCETLSKYVVAKNSRLVNKTLAHVDMEVESFETLVIEWCAISGTDIDSDAYNWVQEVLDKVDTVKCEANEFVAECELKEENLAINKIEQSKLLEVETRVDAFLVAISSSVEETLDEVNADNKHYFLKSLLDDRSAQFEDCSKAITEAKQDIDQKLLVDKLTEKYSRLHSEFDSWKVKVHGYLSEHGPANNKGHPRENVEVKLEKLACPVFSGVHREFARFKREFTNTVEKSIADSDVRLMYLHNQCLQGEPKLLIKGLISYETAWKRLDSRYGDVGVIIKDVLNDIEALKIGNDGELRYVVKIYERVEAAWDDLNAIGVGDELCNAVTLKTLEMKLPIRLQGEWAKVKINARDKSIQAQVRRLKAFLEEQRDMAEQVLSMRNSSGTKNIMSGKSKHKFAGMCTGQDDSSISDERRTESIKNEAKGKGCFRCGGFSHKIKDCRVPSNIKCRSCDSVGHIAKACTKSDSTKPKTEGKKVQFKETSETPQASFVVPTMSNTVSKGHVVLPIEDVKTSEGECTVLWDSGSMLNLVEERWAMQKGLHGKSYRLKYKVVNGVEEDVCTQLYTFDLIDRNGNTKSVRAYGIESIMSVIPQRDLRQLAKKFKALSWRIRKDDFAKPAGSVNLLLGSEWLASFPQVKWEYENMCIMSSLYGTKRFLVAGSHSSLDDLQMCQIPEVHHASVVSVAPSIECCDTIGLHVGEGKRLMKDFLSLEAMWTDVPPKCKLCRNCKVCKFETMQCTFKEAEELRIIKSKLTYLENERKWVASYPFSESPTVLRDNYSMAKSALQKREKRLNKNPEVKGQYIEQVSDFIKRGVIRELTEEELDSWSGPVRYVDHHEVFKAGSTTPLRLVINSSFRSGKEKSLNDILLKGPSSLNDILSILIGWRIYPIAFVGDVAKMYHSVGTGELEGHVRRMLWRDCDSESDIKVYAFQTVTFGDRPAGCIATLALRETADMFGSIDPVAAQSLKRETYMDDVVSGANSRKEAEVRIENLRKIASLGGFNFKEFRTSGKSFEEVKLLGSGQMGRVLGLCWDPLRDMITVNVNLNPNKKVKGQRKEAESLRDTQLTKRICLRLVNSMYDPIGLICPFTVKLKLLMRDQFAGNVSIGWDKPIDSDAAARWMALFDEMEGLNDVVFERCSFGCDLNKCKPMLIGFADASLAAFGSVFYLRHVHPEGVKVSMLLAKAKLGPAKRETVPRMELMSAVLCSRLACKVRECLPCDIEREVYFLDSKVALGMIQNSKSLLKEFIGIRVSEVRSKTKLKDWAWVPSEENIADISSRGSSPRDLDGHSRWQCGPDWLKQPIELWPCEFVSCEPDDADDEEAVMFLNDDYLIDASKYSELSKLTKVTAYVFKAIEHFKELKSDGRKCSVLNVEWKNVEVSVRNYRDAEMYWEREVSKSVMKLYEKGKLTSLRPVPMWQDYGKFRKVVTSGRLGKLLKVGYDTEELTILDPKHPYTRLWLKNCHDADHSGDDRVIWKSRTKYWIPRARRIVSSIRKHCYRCRLRSKVLSRQVMAPLPGERVIPSPPWTNVALDLFGPLEHIDQVRKRLKSKCWGLIVTCMVSRAVHLDVTESYDTDALLQSLRRFQSIRGTPSVIYSDQGSQMMATRKEFENMLELIDWSSVKGWCSKNRTEWRLVPTGGQHMNACAESLIKSTKRILCEKLEGKRVTYAELQTIMYEVSQVLNSRPLGVYSKPGEDPLDGGPLTPNHLLLGRASSSIPDIQYTNVSLTRRVRFLKSIVDEFWQKWYVTVFHSLVPQYKWHKSFRNMQIGDVVLMQNESFVTGKYQMGRVIGVKKSSDGNTRKATVRYVKSGHGTDRVVFGFTDRPIHKLAVIVPIEEQ